MNRREFMAMLAAGGVMTAAGIWMPGEKVISIPSRKIFVPAGGLAWLEGEIACLYRDGEIQRVDTRKFDVAIAGAELMQDTLHMV